MRYLIIGLFLTISKTTSEWGAEMACIERITFESCTNVWRNDTATICSILWDYEVKPTFSAPVSDSDSVTPFQTAKPVANTLPVFAQSKSSNQENIFVSICAVVYGCFVNTLF